MNNNEKQALQERLFKHVDCLAGLIGPRCFQRAGSMDATMGYLRQQWSEMGYTIQEEPFNALSDIATNFVVETPGTRRADEIVVLGGHYDTVLSTPGADDNASAVAVLLEVSRLLKDHVGKRTARYVAFACEEPPYFNVNEMGSQHHARSSKERGDKIVGMLCLEMVGYFKDEPGSQPYPEEIPKWLTWPLPTRGNFLTALGNLASWKLAYQFHRGFKRGSRLPLWALPLPDKFEFIFLSDNRAFWEQGYPALMLTDTAFVRNPNYHQASDTPDTLDYERMAEVALGVASAMKRLLK